MRSFPSSEISRSRESPFDLHPGEPPAVFLEDLGLLRPRLPVELSVQSGHANIYMADYAASEGMRQSKRDDWGSPRTGCKSPGIG